MRLEDQSYQVMDRWKIEIVWHKDLLWFNKQIIRLRENFFLRVWELLKFWNVSLYNHYNPINSDLIRDYKEKKDENDLALLAKIIWSNNLWPILDWNSLSQVKVIEMRNVFFEDITDEDLKKSIAFKNLNEVSIANLIKWLSEEFYAWKLSTTDLEAFQRLFYRKIKSN